jgi:hypothetical protein
MAIKTDGTTMATRSRDAMQGIIGVLLEMQVPADLVKTMFEAALKRAQEQFTRDHEEEIGKAFTDALLKKRV